MIQLAPKILSLILLYQISANIVIIHVSHVISVTLKLNVILVMKLENSTIKTIFVTVNLNFMTQDKIIHAQIVFPVVLVKR